MKDGASRDHVGPSSGVVKGGVRCERSQGEYTSKHADKEGRGQVKEGRPEL